MVSVLPVGSGTRWDRRQWTEGAPAGTSIGPMAPTTAPLLEGAGLSPDVQRHADPWCLDVEFRCVQRTLLAWDVILTATCWLGLGGPQMRCVPVSLRSLSTGLGLWFALGDVGSRKAPDVPSTFTGPAE